MTDAQRPYRPWYERYPKRFEEECAGMEARGFTLNSEALRRDKRVVFDGVSHADDRHHLQVVYPGTFPSGAPRVLDNGGVVLRRHHRPDSKELCLFGPLQGRWTAIQNGTAAIDEAEDVIGVFSGDSPVRDDDVPEPVTNYYTYVPDAAIIVPPSLATPDLADDMSVTIGRFSIRFTSQALSGVTSPFPGRGVVVQTTLLGVKAEAASYYKSRWGTQATQTGSLVVLQEPPPYIRNVGELNAWLQRLSVPQREWREWMAFVFPEQTTTATQQRLAWLVVHKGRRGELHVFRTFALRNDEWTARIPGMDGLATKEIVFIGCGSIGSKIAVALAATGVARFTLIDPDFMEPYNAVRHEIGVDQFGALKVAVLGKRLVDMNPNAAEEIKPIAGQIGGDNPLAVEEAIYDALASADLVVDTTGVHAVSRFINDLCDDLKVPSLYVSVTDGAWGGEVVRVIPGETACWNCWYVQFEDDRPPAALIPDIGFFAPGCDQPTFTGTTYDIGIVANLAARMAVETLLRAMLDRHNFQGDYIRWSARNPDGTPCLNAEVKDVQRRPRCPFCGST